MNFKFNMIIYHFFIELFKMFKTKVLSSYMLCVFIKLIHSLKEGSPPPFPPLWGGLSTKAKEWEITAMNSCDQALLSFPPSPDNAIHKEPPLVGH
jgi:hypothetical protein